MNRVAGWFGAVVLRSLPFLSPSVQHQWLAKSDAQKQSKENKSSRRLLLRSKSNLLLRGSKVPERFDQANIIDVYR